MEKYAKEYLEFFGLTKEDWIPCLLGNHRATEYHHLFPRGKYPEKKFLLENIAPLCRLHHEQFASLKYRSYLQKLVNDKINERRRKTGNEAP